MAEDVGPKFENWKVSGLRGFFLARMFPCVTRQKLCSFRIVIWPFLLDYNPRNHSMSMLLRALVKLYKQGRLYMLDGGMICLPDHDTLAEGWEDSPSSLPNIVQNAMENYFDKSGKIGNVPVISSITPDSCQL